MRVNASIESKDVVAGLRFVFPRVYDFETRLRTVDSTMLPLLQDTKTTAAVNCHVTM
jgi:hypothetical protein